MQHNWVHPEQRPQRRWEKRNRLCGGPTGSTFRGAMSLADFDLWTFIGGQDRTQYQIYYCRWLAPETAQQGRRGLNNLKKRGARKQS